MIFNTWLETWVYWLSLVWYNIDYSQWMYWFDWYQFQLIYLTMEQSPAQNFIDHYWHVHSTFSYTAQISLHFSYVFCCYSVTMSCPTLCNSMDWSIPGFPVLHCLPQFAQTHAFESVSNPLLPTSPPALNLCQHQGLFRWVG